MLLIDTVGVMLAGAAEPSVRILRTTLAASGSVGSALVFGSQERIGPLDAALVNGTAAHAIDFDDMAEAMGGHPSVPVVPAVFALGEALGASGTDVLDAYLVGFEAECRLGRIVHPHHYGSGWHPTATLGVFGAAGASARLLKLDEATTATALAIAASLASGVKANFGTMTKPLHVGNSARSGMMAAMLAHRGFTANPDVFEAKEGFFAAYDGLSNVHVERGLDRPGGLLEIEHNNVGVKQFSCCGSTHPSILAMLELRRAEGLRAEEVEHVEIFTHRRRLPHTDNPDPKTSLGAKFSIQYATARALLDGAVRLSHFENDSFREPAVRELLARTTARPFPELSASADEEMAAEVVVTLYDGRRLTGRSENVLGRGPRNPMSAAELWEKFSDCASLSLREEDVAAAFAALKDFASVENVGKVTRFFEGRVREPATVDA